MQLVFKTRPSIRRLIDLSVVSALCMGAVACVSTGVDASSLPRREVKPKSVLTRSVAPPAPAYEPAKEMNGKEAESARDSAADPDSSAITLEVEGIPQDFAFDDRGQYIYVQSLRKSGGHETGFVSRLRLNGSTASIVDRNLPSELVGHQGVSVENAGGGAPWLWVSRYGDNGREASRFRYQADAVPDDMQIFRFFDDAYMNKNVTMPKVCAGGRHLLVRGRTSPREQYIRLFDLAALNAGGPGDYSSRAIQDWRLPAEAFAEGMPLQGLSCDSKYVYVVIGNARMDDRKSFLKFTLSGKPVPHQQNFSASQRVASSDGKQFEPEGISVLPGRGGKGGAVYVGVLSGNSRDLKFRLWPFDSAR